MPQQQQTQQTESSVQSQKTSDITTSMTTDINRVDANMARIDESVVLSNAVDQEALAEQPNEEFFHHRHNHKQQCNLDNLPWYKFRNVAPAQGFVLIAIGRGAIVMSNIFLATAFLYLASDEANCLDKETGEPLQDTTCPNKVHGFKPASLVAMIATISGLAAAFFMPMMGAMIDFTSLRKLIGQVSCVLILLIQATQIGIGARTWFAMLLLQAVAAFVYRILILVTYAYLPLVARTVNNEAIMTKFTAKFEMCQFTSQATYLVLLIGLTLALDLSDVETARLGQAVAVVWSGVFFWQGWHRTPAVPARNPTQERPKNLLAAGFQQILATAKSLQKDEHLRKGVRWFFLSVAFSEAGVEAFTTLSVIYLDEHVGMSTTEIGIMFLIVLVCTLPGAWFGARVTDRLDPKQSWQWCMYTMVVVTAGGALLVDALQSAYVAFVWGSVLGFLIGWFYSVESLFFSRILPKEQEAEFSGFFAYCNVILGWAPPLLFTGLVEADVSQTVCIMSVALFILTGVILLQQAAPWDEFAITTTKEDEGEGVSERHHQKRRSDSSE